jgi:sec-independent protein translocase protein TatA
MGISVTKLLIVLAIIVVVFGTKRLKNVGSDLGAAIKSFRSAIREEEESVTDKKDGVIDGEVVGKKDDSK